MPKSYDTPIDAIVVTHNSAEDLRAMIATQSTLAAFRRIVVVDNASTDETCDIARAAGFHVEEIGANRGFATAANRGAELIEGAAFAILNPDIAVLNPEDVQRMVRQLADPSIGVVAPALVLPDGDVQDSARRVPSPTDLVARRLASVTPDAVRASCGVDVEWAVGACLIVRTSAFRSIGGFDEGYFLYFEDVDLCVRLTRAGYHVRYDPEVAVAHRHRAASRAALTSPAARHHIRSAIRFYRRHPRYLAPRSMRRSVVPRAVAGRRPS